MHKLNQNEVDAINSILDEEERLFNESMSSNISIAALDEQCKKVFPSWEEYHVKSPVSRQFTTVGESRYTTAYDIKPNQFNTQPRNTFSPPKATYSPPKTNYLVDPSIERQRYSAGSPKTTPEFRFNSAKTSPYATSSPPKTTTGAHGVNARDYNYLDSSSLKSDIDSLFHKIKTMTSGSTPSSPIKEESSLYIPQSNNYTKEPQRKNQFMSQRNYYASEPSSPKSYLNESNSFSGRKYNESPSRNFNTKSSFGGSDSGFVYDNHFDKNYDYGNTNNFSANLNMDPPTPGTGGLPRSAGSPRTKPNFQAPNVAQTSPQDEADLAQLRRDNMQLKSELAGIRRRVQVEAAESKKLEEALQRSQAILERYASQ